MKVICKKCGNEIDYEISDQYRLFGSIIKKMACCEHPDYWAVPI